MSLPVFFTGLLLAYVFYYKLGWAPTPIGRLSFLYSPPPTVTGFYLIDSLLAGDLEVFRAAAAQLVLPVATLAIFSLAPITRMTRASMLPVLASDFVRTARAGGLPSRTVILTYAFRNAMLPVITTLGMVFSFLLGANVLVEKVFAWPGIGSYAVEALITSDFAPVQGFVLTMAVLYVLLNLMIDLLYGVIDPRMRVEAMSTTWHAIATGRRRSLAGSRSSATPLCDQRKPRHRARVRPFHPHRSLRALRPAYRALRSAGERHRRRLKPPSLAHWFGTDQLGRDIFSRVVVATQLDLAIAVFSVALVFLLGGVAGVIAGFFGGWTDRIVGRLADTIMAFPLFVLAMGIVAALGNTVTNIVHRDRDHQFPALCPRRPRRGQCAARRRLRAGGAALRQ